MQSLTTEQKQQAREQVERAVAARTLKENQIRFKLERAKTFDTVAEECADAEDPTGRELAISDAAMLRNDAAMLQCDLAEYVLLVAHLEMNLKAIESNLVIAGGAAVPKQQRRN